MAEVCEAAARLTRDGDLMTLQSRTRLARGLIRGARVATLATVAEQAPHAALVTPACMPDLSVILLLSDLSHHTVQLRANPRCALLCAAASVPAGGFANPQSIPRVSLSCDAEPDDAPTLRERYLMLHPYAAMYAGFGDFHTWRLTIRQCHAVAGFAQAWRNDATELVPSSERVATMAAAQPGIIAHCNIDHADAVTLLGKHLSGVASDWRLAAVDVDGCDLVSMAGIVRAEWPIDVQDAADVRQALGRLIREAREIAVASADTTGAGGVPPAS